MNQIFGEFGLGLVLVMILGLVQLIKKFGVQGNVLVLVSVGIGAAFGVMPSTRFASRDHIQQTVARFMI